MTKATYMKLFQPGYIGKLKIKNRITMAPMGIGALAEPDGRLSERGIDYYAARARGGVGLITTGATWSTRNIVPYRPGYLMADDVTYGGRLNELAEIAHDFGAKVCVQLTLGGGRVGPYTALENVKAVAPSPLPCSWNPEMMARELTRDEIRELAKTFKFCAAMLKRAGIDAVELHAHEGVLLDQFQTALWNRRTDEYGGDLQGRLRFAREIIENIREGAGSDFPIIYRFGLTHYLEGGRQVEEGIELAKSLENLVDAFHVDAGSYETWYWSHPPTTLPPGCMADLAAMLKPKVKIPVISVGKLGYPALAEQLVAEGKADFIALGRALLADPEWPNKVKDGRLSDIRPCVGCHEGCFGRTRDRKYISCAVNPATGIEKEFSLKPAPKKKSVLVVGGGPAGMQAACVAAARGHKVTLWEKNDVLGGNLIYAGVPDFKDDYKQFTEYLNRQVKEMGVAVEFGRKATSASIKSMDPDVLFIATGASPLIPDIPGAKQERVVTAIDVLGGRREIGAEVAIVGGGLIGCETALYLARKGKSVTIVEMLPEAALDLHKANRMHMLKLLAEAGVRILCSARVLQIQDNKVFISGGKEITSDNVVLAVGLKADRKLADELEGKREFQAIGDCVEPRRLMNAIWEGFRAARLV
ncbi:MAG: FAD-dependent oxidoreductase [Chloroflexi bacterium]|nr:FAD-dependent oxidoreductase [Chloroflexota bacterium]